jgi:hypothetical protein
MACRECHIYSTTAISSVDILQYDFEISGEFIVDLDAVVTSQTYTVVPVNTDLIHTDVAWSIVGRDDLAWWAAGSADDSEQDWPSFEIGFESLSEGDYWLEFGVSYSDGSWSFKKLPLRVLYEALSGPFSSRREYGSV